LAATKMMRRSIHVVARSCLVRQNPKITVGRASVSFFSSSGAPAGDNNDASNHIASQFSQKVASKLSQQVSSVNEVSQNVDPTVKDEDIHPDWLAMERRVKSRKSRPKG
jgi:nitrate/TMAO reductase-like tetraheme cytochrome c subunit